MKRLAVVVVVILWLDGRAHAADLRVHDAPAPAHTPATLAMRADPAAPATPPAPPRKIPSLIDRYASFPADLEELSDKVVFHFQLGTQLEQGQISDLPLGSGAPVPEGNRNTRFFTVGDLAVGSHGIGITPLSTYLAAHFRLDQDGVPVTTSSPSIYDLAPDASALLVRSAYAELGDFGTTGWLAGLRVRAGRQFRYGFSVVPFDGVSGWYDHARVSASGFVGQRVSLYREQLDVAGLPLVTREAGEGIVAGASIDLRVVRRGESALVLGGESLVWKDHAYHQATLRWQLNADAALSASARLAGNTIVRWALGARARLSKTSTVQLDGEQRRGDDWAYDFITRSRTAAPGDSHYLFLGPRVPELRLTGRAGTVLLDNLDILLSIAGAVPTRPLFDSPWAAPYLEIGMGIDGRLASGLSLALNVRTRAYFRPEFEATAAQPEPDVFADAAQVGEYALYEGGARLRYAVGRKRFAADFELFLRQVDDSHFERPAGTRLPREEVFVGDVQAGVRLRVEAWIGARARILADYEVSGTPVEDTELRGMQTLRLIGEVSF